MNSGNARVWVVGDNTELVRRVADHLSNDTIHCTGLEPADTRDELERSGPPDLVIIDIQTNHAQSGAWLAQLRDCAIPAPIVVAATLQPGSELTSLVGKFANFALEGRLHPADVELRRQLHEATEHLDFSERQSAIVELAGAAAHELNQPLTSLMAYAELLAKRIDQDDENRKAVDAINNDATRIAHIVRKIGQITQYRTKEYVGGARIVDLDSASEITEAESASGVHPLGVYQLPQPNDD